MEQIVEKLQAAGIKPSLQRIKILEYFHRHENHPTAEQIFRDLKGAMPTLSKATIYNTLSLFLDKGLINTTMADTIHARYDLKNSDHGHFICSRCHRIYDFAYPYPANYSSLAGFAIESEELVIKGVCKDCRTQE